MTTERFDIVVSERGSRVVRRNIEGIGDGARSAAGGVDFLKNALATLGVAAGIREVLATIDAFTNLQNRLRSTGLEGQNLTGVYKELLRVSNETRSSVQGSVELYSRLAVSSKELGVSQSQLVDFTKSLNQAIILSGASATEAQNGLIQLSQGMASGTLRGDELRSVLEQLPAVADVIAKKLGVTRGQLRKMGEDGKITARTILEAFQASREELEERFGKTIPTMGQSLQVLKNNIVDMFGRFDQATGLSEKLSKALMFISENLDTIAKSLVSVVAGFVILQGSIAIVNGVRTAVLALNAAIAANPLGALLVVLLSVITALTLFRDQIKLGIDDTTTLGDLMRAVWETIGPMITEVGRIARDVFGFITQELKASVTLWTGLTFDATKNQESAWLSMLRTVLRVFDMIGAVVRGVMVAVGKTIAFVVSESINRFQQLGDVATKTLTGDFAGAAQTAMQAGKDAAGVFGEIGTIWGTSLTNSLDSQIKGGLEAGLDKLIDRAKQIGKERLAAEAANVGVIDTKAPPGVDLPGGKGDKDKKKKKLIDELQQLVSQYDKVYAAQQEYAKAVALLDKAEAAGLITKERKAEVLELINDQLKDALDPLGALNREMDKELDLLKLGAKEREIEIQLRALQQDLMSSGKKLTEDELKLLREKLVLTQQQNALDEARQRLRGDTRAGRDEKAAIDMSAFKDLIANNSADKNDQFNFLNNMLGGSLDDTKMELEARAAQMQEYFDRVRAMQSSGVIDAQTASAAIQAIKQKELDTNLQRTSDALGAAAGLMKSNSKEAFKVGQAAAIGQAIVNTYTAATAAYQSAANIPYVGWILGPIAAAGAIAAGMAQVSAIRSQQMPAYRTGGEYMVGGMGGVDSQTVAFRATPGERISINTPQQAHAMQNVERMMKQGEVGGGRNVTQNVTIVQQGRPDNRTPEQNAKAFRRAAVAMEY